MTKEQIIFKRINILLYQLAESIERGEIKMDWFRKPSDEIDALIDELNPSIDNK